MRLVFDCIRLLQARYCQIPHGSGTELAETAKKRKIHLFIPIFLKKFKIYKKQ